MFDPGDWLPFAGVVMLAGTTVVSIVGAYAFGRLRGERNPREIVDAEARRRTEELERAIEAMAVEIERVGEGQRFLLKVLADRPIAAPRVDQRVPGIITPH